MRRRALLSSLAIFTTLGLVGPTAASAQGPTVVARDAETNALIADFTYLVNEDNAGDPGAADPFDRPGLHPMASNSPVVHSGDQSSSSLPALPAGRYLVTVRADGYKLWGRHVTLPSSSPTLEVVLTPGPHPAADLVVHAFQDNRAVNGAPDVPLESGLAGFNVILEDTVGEVVVDINNEPLCGGQCVTDANGDVRIEDLPPGKYEVQVIPPDGDGWIQTSTFEGKPVVDAWLMEGDDGFGARREALIETPRTAFWFGFVKEMPFEAPGTGTISGNARTWLGWPPFDTLTFGEPVAAPAQGYVALSNGGPAIDSAPPSEQQVYTAPIGPEGDFVIEGVPPGIYTLALWDFDLDWIIRFTLVTVGPDQDVDLNTVDVNGQSGFGVARWFGWLSGTVFADDGLDADGNPVGTPEDGVRQDGEVGIPGVDLDVRWRDGSVFQATFTDGDGNYVFPEQIGKLGKFEVAEVGFGNGKRTGGSLRNEHETVFTRLPGELGGDLLFAQRTLESHRTELNFGRVPYVGDENGGVSGIVYFATTRNELDPSLAAAEDYEPGIPGVTVQLYRVADPAACNPNSDPRSAACAPGELLNAVQTDDWLQPTDCDVRDATGALYPAPAFVSANCVEVPMIANETKDGRFDGGYAIESVCDVANGSTPDPTGADGCSGDELALPPGDFVVQVVPPEHFQIVKEEDQNTAQGDEIVPQVPPPPCVGGDHEVGLGDPTPMDPPHPDDGEMKPLCDKKLVTVEAGQNAGNDYFLFTDNEVPIPGRIFGLVSNDLLFETDPDNIWYGEARAIPDTPIGVYDYTGKLIKTITTDENGFYEILLPSTYTALCPTPSGVCPGMYDLIINDPGTRANPNTNFKADFLTAILAFDVWPGKTTYADTPLDPISTFTCNAYAGPQLFSTSKVWIRTTDLTNASRRFQIRGVDFTSVNTGTPTVTLDNSPLIVESFNDTTINVRIPLAIPFLSAGPRQLRVRAPNGFESVNGLTFHILPASATAAPVRTVGGPAGSPNPAPTIQAAIDASSRSATVNTLIDVFPGVYRENLLMDRRVKLQGHGPGGLVGGNREPLQPPDDPRFNVPGSVVDARYFRDIFPNATGAGSWAARLNTSRPFAGFQNPSGGAGITVVARGNAFNDGNADAAAAIDGFGVALGQSIGLTGGAGGIHVNGNAHRLRLTNNIFEGNGGEWAGAVTLGLPEVITDGGATPLPDGDNNNDNVVLRFNRVLGNGGTQGGGIGIYAGAESYLVANNDICANYSVNYGGGVSQQGRSPGGVIRDNRIFFNDAFDEGGGLSVGGELQASGLSRGSGRVNIERNEIQQNISNDDGGGIRIQNANTDRIDIINNMVVDNVATDIGGGIALDDASNVRIVNNTIAENATTSTAEDSDGLPHGAGLVSEPHSSQFQATLPAGAARFSNAVLINNIFWDNHAYTYDPTDPDFRIDQGVIDLEVVHATATTCTGGPPCFFTPRYSVLTVAYGPAHPTNNVGGDPNFVNAVPVEFFIEPNRLNPAEVTVTINRLDPQEPVNPAEGDLAYDYHIQAGSSANNTGCGPILVFVCPLVDVTPPTSPLFLQGLGFIPPVLDFERQVRPQALRWDKGADERYQGLGPIGGVQIP